MNNRLVKGLALVLVMITVSSTQSFAQPQTATVCSGTPFYFYKPGAVAGTTYTWSAPNILPAAGAITGGAAQSTPQTSVSELLENTTTFQAKATYTVVATNPNTSATETFTLEVTVNPLPELTSSPTPAAICSGTAFNYVPQSSTPNSGFAWSRLAVPGVSNVGAQGNGNPNEILSNTTVMPVTVIYKYTVTANGCSKGEQEVAVDVNPIPFLSSSLLPAAVCSGSTFNYVPASPNANSYSWTRAAVAGISNTAGQSNGNPEIHELLQNTTLTPRLVAYRYTLTNTSLTCSSNTQVIEVVVNPTAVVANQTITSLCNTNAFLSSPANVPEGTLYTWNTPAPINSTANIIGGSAVSVGQLFISQQLTNLGTSTETLRYTVTANSGGCIGSTFFVDVPVNTTSNSRAELTNPTPAGICSGGTFNFTPASATASSYSWKRFYNSSIAQSANQSNNTSGNITEILTNTTSIQTTAYYAYTLFTPNGCSNTVTLAVPVNPPTSLSTPLTPVPICSSTTFNYEPASATPNTSFAWTRAVVTGISNSADGGTGNPKETLVNTTPNPIPVVYRYAMTTPDGCNNAQNVTVVVNPTPLLTSTANPAAVCSGSPFTYNPASSSSGVSFSWTRAAVPSISNAAGSGNGVVLSEILVDTSIVSVPVVYNYIVSANGCASPAQPVTVVVKPTPRVSGQFVTACSKTTLELPALNVPAGTTYGWAPPSITPLSSLAGANAVTLTGETSFTQFLTNQTLNPAFAVYNVTPVTNGCTGVTFRVDATINPVPVVANQQLQSVCSGVGFSYSNGSVPTGTTYTWSSPVQTPLNSLTGASAQSIGQSSISQLLSSTNNQTNTAVYTVTPTAYGCAGQTFMLTVPVNPTPAINSITDTICSAGSFVLAPTAPSNTTYSWGLPTSLPFGAIVGSSAQTGQTTISQTLTNATNTNGRAVYTVTPTSGTCVGPTFNVSVTVGVPLPFTPDQAALICSGTAFDVTPATARPGTSYTWSVPTITPAGSIVGASAVTTPQTFISQKLDNLITRTDTVEYTILPYNTGCRGNIFKATVRVLPLPTATITGSPVICRTPTDTVSVSFTGTGPWSFNYTNGNTTGTQTGITTSPYKWAVAAIPDLASRALSISEVRDFACVNTGNTGVFVQKVNPLPTAQMVSLHGIYICNNIQDTLLVQSLRSTDVLSYQWTRNGTPVPNAVRDTFITSQAGRYNVTLVNQFGCTDTIAAPIPVSVVLQPVLRISLDSYCVDKQIQFTNLTDTLSIGATTWLWDFGDTTTSTAFHPTHTYARAGKHHLRLTAVQAFCAGYTTSADAILDVQAPIPGITMPSVSTYKGTITPLAVRALPNYTYRWNPSRGIDRPDSASVNFDLSSTQQYAVSLISSGGCVTTDSLLVRVFDDKLQNIFVPKSFTPNNDGINDKLYPYLSGIKEFKYFKVFNRFGKLMFETTNPDIGWNGSVNGTAQPMGIYLWFSVGTALDGTPVENKGQTLLIR
ncbi:T9SS type B sorting domain-containing protein [Sediminibacterium roseum]|uniref:T9SS type B sorting domain-containing protein n=1 Tax=Sediminibacterium roseum TaxID=1978412 RepID=A0ABW9ZX17_9BACT|nr:PKD-like domain-containing protein [Sediminibacterium roseum]NCI51701.1 T9SS type B sorting domain-containing protein [Sediminibacterium roseum]